MYEKKNRISLRLDTSLEKFIYDYLNNGIVIKFKIKKMKNLKRKK